MSENLQPYFSTRYVAGMLKASPMKHMIVMPKVSSLSVIC